MLVQMRNKTTGEFRDVEADSPEFRKLKAQVATPGFPMWEQTNYEHADAVKGRAAYGELLEDDLGDELKNILKHEALVMDAEGVAPEANPHLALTPGEIDAGMTPESKLEEIHTQYAPSVPRRHELLDKAADLIADERKTRAPKQGSKGLRARAGGPEDKPPGGDSDASTENDSSGEDNNEDGSEGDDSSSVSEQAAAIAGKAGKPAVE